MKIKTLLAILSAMATSGLSAAPDIRNFGLKVKVDGKATYDNDTIIQTRKLALTLSLSGKEPAPGLVVKWTIYGHSRSNHDPVAIKSGELKVDLTAGQSVALETPQVTITGVREHSVSTGSGRRRKSKTVPASGQEYFGYSAVVMNGNIVVAEVSSNGALKSKPSEKP